MKITIVNHSDTRGGASVVSVRLMEALRAQGVDARMIVEHKATSSQHIAAIGDKCQKKATFLAECAEIFTHNGFSRANLFKVSTGSFGLPLCSHPWIADADIVMLNWVNQGMLSLSEIAKIKAPVVWTLHDMWCLTGICHHAAACRHYKQACGDCNFLGFMASPSDLSHKAWLKKQDLYSRKPIAFVAVSSWLARKCRESSLLQGQRVEVIPNAFPVAQYSTVARLPRAHYGLPDSKQLIAMGAARLDDPIKGFDLAIDALNYVASANPQAHAALFGDLRDKSMLQRLKMPYTYLGPLASASSINDIYAHSSVVISASHYETLPGTLIEGMAAGCVPVTFGQGGQADIVDHLSTGYIAQHPDVQDLARGIDWALRMATQGNPLRQSQRRAIEQRFDATSVAQRYIALCLDLLNMPHDNPNHPI